MSTMMKVSTFDKDKIIVKLNGVSVIPEFKELNGRRVPDDSKPPFVVEQHGKYFIGKFRIQAELTGTQKLNLFDEKEVGDGKVTIYLSVFDKFQNEAGKKLANNDKLDVLITDLKLTEKGYHTATCLFLQKTESYVKMPYQYSWSKKITENDIGKSIISSCIKFQRPQVKNPDGSYTKDDSIPYFTVQTFSNGSEYANIKSLVSLHYKTAKFVFGEDDERFKNKDGQYVTYFPSLLATNRVLKQLKGLNKYMDKPFIADMLLEKNDKYYNGQLFSLSFTKKAKDEETSENTSEDNKATNAPDFPEIPDEVKETSKDNESVETNSSKNSEADEKDFPTLEEDSSSEEEIPFNEDEAMPDFSEFGM